MTASYTPQDLRVRQECATKLSPNVSTVLCRAAKRVAAAVPIGTAPALIYFLQHGIKPLIQDSLILTLLVWTAFKKNAASLAERGHHEPHIR